MPIQLNGTTICYDIPTGAIMMGPVSTMDGFLLCDGSQVSRITYSKLFALIGTNFGAGDGSTTFNVPDYRGCFLRMFGGDSAADMYTKQNSGSPNITGTIEGGSGNDGVSAGGYGVFRTATGVFEARNQRQYSPSNYQGSYPSGNPFSGITFDASRSSSVYQNDLTEVRPVNYAVNYFIKY